MSVLNLQNHTKASVVSLAYSEIRKGHIKMCLDILHGLVDSLKSADHKKVVSKTISIVKDYLQASSNTKHHLALKVGRAFDNVIRTLGISKDFYKDNE